MAFAFYIRKVQNAYRDAETEGEEEGRWEGYEKTIALSAVSTRRKIQYLKFILK